MRCYQAQELFSPYLDDVLSVMQRALLERHLAYCSHCREELAAWEETVAAIRGLKLIDPPRDFSLQVKERLRRVGRRGTQPKGVYWRGFLSWGAAAVILLFLMAGSFAAGLWPPGGTGSRAIIEDKLEGGRLNNREVSAEGSSACIASDDFCTSLESTEVTNETAKPQKGQQESKEKKAEEKPKDKVVVTAQPAPKPPAEIANAIAGAAERDKRVEQLRLSSRNGSEAFSGDELQAALQATPEEGGKDVAAHVYSGIRARTTGSTVTHYSKTVNLSLVVNDPEVTYKDIVKSLLAEGCRSAITLPEPEVKQKPEIIIKAWLPRECLPELLPALEKQGKIQRSEEITEDITVIYRETESNLRLMEEKLAAAQQAETKESLNKLIEEIKAAKARLADLELRATLLQITVTLIPSQPVSDMGQRVSLPQKTAEPEPTPEKSGIIQPESSLTSSR